MIKRIIDKIISIMLNLYYLSYREKLFYCGKMLKLHFGLRIDHPECIYIGNNVFINSYVWLSANRYSYEENQDILENKPHIVINDNSYIGRFVSISCVDSVYIGKKVLISDRCYIGDIQHNFHNISISIKDQYVTSKGKVSVGDESWIGNNVSILPGVSIGKHCVIGANSVVTHNIPDYSIAVGNPAKIIKQLDNKNDSTNSI